MGTPPIPLQVRIDAQFPSIEVVCGDPGIIEVTTHVGPGRNEPLLKCSRGINIRNTKTERQTDPSRIVFVIFSTPNSIKFCQQVLFLLDKVISRREIRLICDDFYCWNISQKLDE